jgi:hypothetical protein
MNTKFFAVLSVLFALSSFSAMADQSNDNIDGAVRCTAGDDLTIVINAQRTRFSVADGSGVTAYYTVVRREGGDVSTYYVGRTAKGNVTVLGFDDRGDYFSFKRGQSMPVDNCQKVGR